jgi:hypothetical protein
LGNPSSTGDSGILGSSGGCRSGGVEGALESGVDSWSDGVLYGDNEIVGDCEYGRTLGDSGSGVGVAGWCGGDPGGRSAGSS